MRGMLINVIFYKISSVLTNQHSAILSVEGVLKTKKKIISLNFFVYV